MIPPLKTRVLKTSANGEKKHKSGFLTRISAVNYAGASETTNGVHPRRTVGTATTTRILLSTKLDPIAERRRPPWSHRTESILKEAPKTPCTVPGRSADSGIPIPTTKANHPTYRTRELMALRKSPLSQETFKWITPRDEAKRRITFPQLPPGTTTIGVLDRVKMVSTAPATYSLLPTPFNSAGHANCRKVSMCQPLRTTNEKCLKLPRIFMSAQEIVRHYGMLLSNYELCEIKDYKDIWYFGQRCRKKPYCPDSGGKNFGFDDEKGGYNVIPHDHMAYRYEILDHLGKGSFGRVVRAYDHRQHMQVAVKIIRNKSKFHKQAKTEVKILRLLQKDTTANENTVKMLDHFVFRRHPCIVHELLGKNLYDVLKANHFRGFYMSHIRKITLCILRCLLMLHEKGIIHCDLKPENILLIPGSQCEVKIVDFGSSCKKTEVLYNYIQSRFYRAPEVILGIPYGLPIDMWSLGCILPELLTGKPLFPGQDEFDQICCCVELLGLPPKSLLKDASRRNIFFDSRGRLRTETGQKSRRKESNSRTFDTLLNCSDRNFIDFITKCLRWKPEDRLSPKDAFGHPWIREERQESFILPRVRISVSSAQVNTKSVAEHVHKIPSSIQRSSPLNEKRCKTRREYDDG